MINFATHTAHLLSWIPDGHEEVLYLSPVAHMEKGKAIRGGVPICWPWFGPKKNQPSHGLARINPWRKRSENKFEFNTNEAKLTLEVIEVENTLTLKLTTENTTFKTYDFTQALHTYFQVGDIKQVSILGHEEETYFDKVLNEEAVQEGTIAFVGETDRIYKTKNPSILVDPVMNREITISKEGSESTVIWNPGVEKAKAMADMPDEDFVTMCCVEAANTHLDPVALRATEKHVLIQKLSIKHL